MIWRSNPFGAVPVEASASYGGRGRASFGHPGNFTLIKDEQGVTVGAAPVGGGAPVYTRPAPASTLAMDLGGAPASKFKPVIIIAIVLGGALLIRKARG